MPQETFTGEDRYKQLERWRAVMATRSEKFAILEHRNKAGTSDAEPTVTVDYFFPEDAPVSDMPCPTCGGRPEA